MGLPFNTWKFNADALNLTTLTAFNFQIEFHCLLYEFTGYNLTANF